MFVAAIYITYFRFQSDKASSHDPHQSNSSQTLRPPNYRCEPSKHCIAASFPLVNPRVQLAILRRPRRRLWPPSALLLPSTPKPTLHSGELRTEGTAAQLLRTRSQKTYCRPLLPHFRVQICGWEVRTSDQGPARHFGLSCYGLGLFDRKEGGW